MTDGLGPVVGRGDVKTEIVHLQSRLPEPVRCGLTLDVENVAGQDLCTFGGESFGVRGTLATGRASDDDALAVQPPADRACGVDWQRRLLSRGSSLSSSRSVNFGRSGVGVGLVLCRHLED